MYCHTFLFHAAKLNVPLATTGLFIPSHFLGQKEVNSPAGSQCSFVFLLARTWTQRPECDLFHCCIYQSMTSVCVHEFEHCFLPLTWNCSWASELNKVITSLSLFLSYPLSPHVLIIPR